jgi:hypothetical protein
LGSSIRSSWRRSVFIRCSTSSIRTAPRRHRSLGDTLFFHSLGNLPGQDPLDGGVLVFLKDTLAGEKVIERLLADARFALTFLVRCHAFNSFLRLAARAISCGGVFCVFLMKPCKSTRSPAAMQKNHPRDCAVA